MGLLFRHIDLIKRMFSGVILLLFIVFNMAAQEEVGTFEQEIVDNSYTFFCEQIIDSDENLTDVTIRFNGKTSTAYSRVIYVANCLGDIDLVTNQIPNRDYIYDLQEHYDKMPPHYIKVSDLDSRTKKFVFKKSNKILADLYIFRPIVYRDYHYILFYILFGKEFKIFYGIRLDEEHQVIDFCTKAYSL